MALPHDDKYPLTNPKEENILVKCHFLKIFWQSLFSETKEQCTFLSLYFEEALLRAATSHVILDHHQSPSFLVPRASVLWFDL